jgi:hypothetical protein
LLLDTADVAADVNPSLEGLAPLPRLTPSCFLRGLRLTLTHFLEGLARCLTAAREGGPLNTIRSQDLVASLTKRSRGTSVNETCMHEHVYAGL